MNVPDVAAAEKYYVDTFGMSGRKPLDSNGYAPKSPKGSRLMTFGEPKARGVLRPCTRPTSNRSTHSERLYERVP